MSLFRHESEGVKLTSQRIFATHCRLTQAASRRPTSTVNASGASRPAFGSGRCDERAIERTGRHPSTSQSALPARG